MARDDVVDLSKDIVNARIDEMLCRAEETGFGNGKIEGERKGRSEERKEIVISLLESMSPEEISSKTNIPLDEILEIRNYGFL